MSQCIIFDCDGVLLDSNSMKTDAFRFCLLGHPPKIVEDFIAYQIKNFGKSRRILFETFFEKFLLKETDNASIEAMVEKFGQFTSSKYLEVKETNEMRTNLERLIFLGFDLYVVSGSDQYELNEVFLKRGLAKYFKLILGSPISKFENLKSLKSSLLKENDEVLCYVGDAANDLFAANKCNIDFVYMTDYEAAPIGLPVDFEIRDLSHFEARYLYQKNKILKM